MAFSPELLHTREQRQAEDRQERVGNPDSGKRRQGPFSRETRAEDRKQIISSDQEHSDKRTCGPASATRLGSQRNGDQSKSKTSHGEGEAAVQFDASFAPARPPIVNQFAKRAL